MCIRDRPIDAFEKLAFEAQFQALSTGGAISYVEVPNMQQNLEAVMQIIRYIYDNIMYAELNTKSDYCQACGYDGEMCIRDRFYMARRSAGYLPRCPWLTISTASGPVSYTHLDVYKRQR